MLIGVAVALVLLTADWDETEEPNEQETSAIVGNREHQDDVKACTATAMHRGQPVHSARIQATLTIDAGAVSAVSVDAPGDLAAVAACLERRLRRWTFPVRADSYSIELPVILQGSAH